jgi:vancomycin resistance protein VanJ
MRRRHWAIAAFASLYPVSLLGVVVALRYVGERWWVTGVGMYLPRLLLAAPLPFFVIALAVARLPQLLWTQIVAALLLLFPLMGFAFPSPTSGARDASSLRILSYNINSAVGGANTIFEEIERYSPDVVLLQEVDGAEAIGNLLRGRYPTVNELHQFLLATRFPVLSTTDPEKLTYQERSRSPRFVQHVLETPLGRIVFYNVHPLSPREVFYALRGQGLRRELLSGRLFSRDNASAFRTNAELRALQVQHFAEAARRETGPVVVAGDTNLPGLSYLFGEYLSDYQDGFVKAGGGFGYTFPTNRGPWMRIDRILASEHLRFTRFEVGSSLSSDHLCVVADLRRRPP